MVPSLQYHGFDSCLRLPIFLLTDLLIGEMSCTVVKTGCDSGDFCGLHSIYIQDAEALFLNFYTECGSTFFSYFTYNSTQTSPVLMGCLGISLNESI